MALLAKGGTGASANIAMDVTQPRASASGMSSGKRGWQCDSTNAWASSRGITALFSHAALSEHLPDGWPHRRVKERERQIRLQQTQHAACVVDSAVDHEP